MWLYRLRFNIPENYRFYHEETSIPFRLKTGEFVTIKARDASKLIDTNKLEAISDLYVSSDIAKQAALKFITAARLASARLKMGIDTGIDRTVLAPKSKEEADDLNEVGLNVYEGEVEKKISLTLKSSYSLPKVEEFMELVAKLLDINPTLSSKEDTSLELYNFAQFEGSLRAKFISLYSALEALPSRTRRSKEEITLIKQLIEKARNSSLSVEKKNRLINSLGYLEFDSSRTACRKIIRGHLGAKHVREFERLADLRNRLLHDGQVPEGMDLLSKTVKLDNLVLSLLIKKIIGKDVLYDIIKKHRNLKE